MQRDTASSTPKSYLLRERDFCARVVSCGRRRDSVSAVIKQLKWLTAKQLVTYHTVCAAERTIVSGQPERLRGTMGHRGTTGHRASQRHRHDTRSACLFTLPAIRTEAGRRRLCYRGVTRLNDPKDESGILCYRAKVRKARLSGPE